MSAKKIIGNLYLGDIDSIPDDMDLIISCAEETYNTVLKTQKIKKTNQKYFWTDNKHIFYNFQDYPILGEIDMNLVSSVINLIYKNINSKKIYIHCIWGLNRSASLVFIFLVLINKLNNEDFNNAYEKFESIYPYIDPNYGWWEFLVSYFPYNQFALN